MKYRLSTSNERVWCTTQLATWVQLFNRSYSQLTFFIFFTKCLNKNSFQLLFIHKLYTRYQAGGNFEFLAHATTICTNSWYVHNLRHSDRGVGLLISAKHRIWGETYIRVYILCVFFSSWSNISTPEYWSLSCDHGLHLPGSDEVM